MFSTQQNGGNIMTMAPVDKDVETCFFCGEVATQEQGTAYYRAQLPTGEWGSVPICLRCLLNKKRLEERAEVDKLGIDETSDN